VLFRSITVTPVNDAPVAVPQTVAAAINTPLTITLAGTDAEGAALLFTITSQPVHGTLSGGAATPTYTPQTGFLGPDSFTFEVSDGQLTSGPATVTINVMPPPNFESVPVIMPDPTVVGQPVLAQAGAGNAAITWNFGDGTVVTGTSVTHVYTQPGVYTITVTATSPEGLKTTYQTDIFVGSAMAGPNPTGVGAGGALPPGATGILVGGAGISGKAGVGKVICNYARRTQTSIAGTVIGISFPATLTQAQLVGQPGVLTVGTGPTAQTFVFTLSKSGRGKATSLQSIEVNLKKQRFRFKVNNRPALVDTIEALGGTWVRDTKRGPVQMILVPATLQVGNSIFLAYTFQMEYIRIGDVGKGGTTPVK
jgi:hypothetical protein